MTVATILRNKGGDVVAAGRDDRVGDTVRLLAEKRIGAVPVTDGDGQVLGILSERDVLYGLAREGAALLDRRVSEVMTAPALTVTSDTSLLAALALMTQRRIRHLPVVDGGGMIGFISIGDLVKLRIDRIEAEADAMRQYIAGN
ncbi:CBS domain-containing protein [Sphingomonas sp.]|uniref:CBS domain-containing protein n=1 Tax=Sphingomonas sp. TaxID=28214 RepID=UPI003B00CD5B